MTTVAPDVGAAVLRALPGCRVSDLDLRDNALLPAERVVYDGTVPRIADDDGLEAELRSVASELRRACSKSRVATLRLEGNQVGLRAARVLSQPLCAHPNAETLGLEHKPRVVVRGHVDGDRDAHVWHHTAP